MLLSSYYSIFRLVNSIFIEHGKHLPIDAWLDPYYLSSVVAISLEAHRVKTLSSSTSMKTFSPEHRSLSEMHLCFVWNDYPQLLPEGFLLVEGQVGINGKVWDESFPSYTMQTHVYAFNKGKVLCVVPGVFVWPDAVLAPGDRIGRLSKKAPDLIKPFSNNLAVLYGIRPEITQQLGLTYQ